MEKRKIIRMLSSWLSNKTDENGAKKSYFEATNEAQDYYMKIEELEKKLNK